MFGWFDSTAHPGMASLTHISSFVLILLMKVLLRNELGFMFDQEKKKRKKPLELFLCVRYKLCLFCMLSMKDISECQLFIRAAIFIYLRIPEKVGVRVNLPILLFILDFTKGKRLPYSGNIPNAQPPKGVNFYLFT